MTTDLGGQDLKPGVRVRAWSDRPSTALLGKVIETTDQDVLVAWKDGSRRRYPAYDGKVEAVVKADK